MMEMVQQAMTTVAMAMAMVGDKVDNDVDSVTGKDDDDDHIQKPNPGKFTKKILQLPWSSPYTILKVWNSGFC